MNRHYLVPSLGLFLLLAWAKNSLSIGAEPLEPQWQPIRKLVATPVSFKPNLLDERKTPHLTQVTAVAVRGVFPVDEQIAELVRQLVDEQFAEIAGTLALEKATAAKSLTILDFAFERQSLPEDADRWKAAEPKWERLTVDRGKELLGSVANFAPEIVAAEHVDLMMTMPLPQLAEGEWTHSAVGHPLLNERDAKGLLFRFLDLDVKPGFYYRYRVKLIVENPMRGEHSADPFLWLGNTRETPWSRPSRAIRVGRDQANADAEN